MRSVPGRAWFARPWCDGLSVVDLIRSATNTLSVISGSSVMRALIQSVESASLPCPSPSPCVGGASNPMARRSLVRLFKNCGERGVHYKKATTRARNSIGCGLPICDPQYRSHQQKPHLRQLKVFRGKPETQINENLKRYGVPRSRSSFSRVAFRQPPSGTDEVAGIAVRYTLQIILMFGFGLPEISCGFQFGHDFPRP